MSNKCIVHNKHFKTLAEMSGLSPMQLEAKMNLWMEKNNTEEWPSLEQLGFEGKAVDDSTEVNPENVIEESTNKTISIEPNYALNFADSADSYVNPEVEAEIEREQNEAKVDEEIGVKENLTEEEYWVGDRLSFSNLTETLALQHRDTDNELRNLYDEKNKATGKNRDKLNKKIAELEERLSMLKDKVEESNKIANLEQIVQYGVDAYKEVQKILSGEVNAAQLNYAKRVVDFWINAGKKEHSQFGHVLFGEMYYDKVPAEIQEGLFDIREAMADMSNKIHTIDRQFVTDMVNKQLRADYSVDDIYRAFRDINFGEEMAFGLGDYGSPLLSAMYASMNKADYFAAEEFRVVSKDIDRLFKNADKFMSGKGTEKYKMFMQEQNGVLTGDLVKIFSKDYFDTKYGKLRAAQNAGTREAWDEFKKWSKENEETLDIRLLFPQGELTEAQQLAADNHRKKIVDLVGPRLYDQYVKKLELIIEDYHYEKRQREIFLESQGLSDSDFNAAMSQFAHSRSPFVEMDRRFGILNQDGTYGSDIVMYGGKPSYADKLVRGILSVPKDKYSDGKPTGHYDAKYKVIANNKETLELYEYINELLSTMRSVLPHNLRGEIGSNTLPLIYKDTVEKFSENAGLGMANLWNELQRGFLVSEVNDIEYDEIDVNTKKVVGALKANTNMHSKTVINERLKIKVVDFFARNGVDPSKDETAKLRLEVIKELNNERSFDLPRIIKMYAGSMATYKHKAKIDDALTIARRALNDIAEISLSTSNTEMRDKAGNLRAEEGLVRTKAAVDYALKGFRGEKLHKDSGKILSKKFTHHDKLKLAEYLAIKDKLNKLLSDEKITKEEYTARNKVVDSNIEKLGGHVHLTKIGDNLLQWNQLKGMGLNPIAGFVNVLVGWMENSIRAADGRWFNETQYNESMRDVFASVFSKKENPIKSKLIAIEKRFSLVEDASQELYQKTDKFGKVVYVIVRKTEFVNVMSMATAMMRNIPVKNDKGEVSNLYEAFDDNGNIKEGWKLSDEMSNSDFLAEVAITIRRIKHKTQGNYGDKLKGKEHLFGRMIFQFRTWMPEMYNARFGKSDYDPILKKEIKGRWRSVTTLGGSEFEGNQFTAAENVIHTLKQLGKKILFMRTSFDGRMSESDAANMKANLMELHFLLGTILLMLVLRAAVDDDDEKRNFTFNMLINLTTRMQNDILVFANPMTFEQINKNVLPVMSILTGATGVVKAVKNEFSDDERKSGKSLEKLAKETPILSQGIRAYNYAAKEIAK